MVLPDEEIKEESRYSWTSIEFLLPLIIIIFMLLFIGRLGNFELDFAQVIFFGCFALGWSSVLTMDEFRHKTRKVVFPTGFSTFDGSILINRHSNNAIVRCGSLRALGVEIDEINEGHAIIPLDCIKKTGKCAVIMADSIKQVKLKDIDDKLAVIWFLKNGIGEPYYQARNYSQKELRRPDYKVLDNLLVSMRSANDQLKEKIESKFRATESSVSSGSRIRDIATEATEIVEDLKRMKKNHN